MAIYNVKDGKEVLVADISSPANWIAAPEQKGHILNKPDLVTVQDVQNIVNEAAIGTNVIAHLTSMQGASLTTFVANKLNNVQEFNALREMTNSFWADQGLFGPPPLNQPIDHHQEYKDRFKESIVSFYFNSYLGDEEHVLTFGSRNTADNPIPETISIIPFKKLTRNGIVSTEYFDLGEQPYSLKCKVDGLVAFKIRLLNSASLGMGLNDAPNTVRTLFGERVLLPKYLIIQKYNNGNWETVNSASYNINIIHNRGYDGRIQTQIELVQEVKTNDELRFCILNKANDAELRVGYHLILDEEESTSVSAYYLTIPDNHPTANPIDHPDSSITTPKYIDRSVTSVKLAEDIEIKNLIITNNTTFQYPPIVINAPSTYQEFLQLDNNVLVNVGVVREVMVEFERRIKELEDKLIFNSNRNIITDNQGNLINGLPAHTSHFISTNEPTGAPTGYAPIWIKIDQE